MKRVLYAEQNFDGTTGGSHHSLLEIIRHLDRELYQPVVLFYEKNALFEKFQAECPVYILRRKRPVHLDALNRSRFSPARAAASVIQKGINFFKVFIPLTLAAARFIARHKIDLVHLNNSVEEGNAWILAAKLTGRTVITHNRGFAHPGAVDRFFIRRLDAVIAISGFLTGELERRGVKTGKKFITIYNGIDADEVVSRLKKSASQTRELLGIPDGSPVIGIVGNLKRWKGQETVIRACGILRKEYPGLRCLVAGAVSETRLEDREYMRTLRTLLQQFDLGEKVLFLGFRDDIPDIINCLDVLVHASTEPEPLGRVILEGMVLRKPVVASALGGPLEIMQDQETGILVSPGRPRPLASAIGGLLGKPDKRERIAEAGYRSVRERFSIDRNVQQIQSLYKSLLSSEKRS